MTQNVKNKNMKYLKSYKKLFLLLFYEMKDIIIFFKGHLILNYCAAPYPCIYDPTIIRNYRDIYFFTDSMHTKVYSIKRRDIRIKTFLEIHLIKIISEWVHSYQQKSQHSERNHSKYGIEKVQFQSILFCSNQIRKQFFPNPYFKRVAVENGTGDKFIKP